jgi:hypothetical protein
MKLFLFLIACTMGLFFASCKDRDDYKMVPDEVEGFRPVYFDTSTSIVSLVFSAKPRPINKTGKVYLYKNYLFINEPGLGVHVFENSDPANPVAMAFINVPYNYDMAVKDPAMYMNTYMGLVVIDISKLPDITILDFIRSRSNKTSGIPPLPSGPDFSNGLSLHGKTYFECIDASRGVVVGWESATLAKPRCYNQ